MKHILLLFGLVSLMSCSTDPITTHEATTDSSRRSGDNYGVVHVTDLFAGQTILIGSVEVANYDDTVYVTYRTNNGWQIDKTHLFVGDFSQMPINGGGNPKVGKFPYKGNHPNGTVEVTFEGPSVFSGMCYYNAAHAQVKNINSGQTESAWADGTPIGGNNWATGFEACF